MKSKQELLLSNLKDTSSLYEIQTYIKEIIDIRGFGNQNIEQTMLLLTEEVGELAKAIRKDATTMSSDKSKLYNYDSIESEVADVFIVLTSICNKLNIDMFKALEEKEKEKEKEKINTNRNWTR